MDNPILYIETSSDLCSVSLCDGPHLVNEVKATKERSHSSHLTLLIEEVLSISNITTSHLVAIGLGSGPGSYTGLRVGSSVSRGLAFALNIPLMAIPHLEAFATHHYNGDPGLKIVSSIKAREDEVYIAIYNGLGEQELTQQPIKVDSADWVKVSSLLTNTSSLLCGTGVGVIKDHLNTEYQIIESSGLSSEFALLGYNRFKNQQFDDIAYFDLNYIKSPLITKSKKTSLFTPFVKK